MRLAGDIDNVSDADFSADGKEVLTASDDRSARVWDAATGQELYRLEIFSQAVKEARFSDEGQSVLTLSEDRVARLTPLNAFEDPQLRDPDLNKVIARVCGAYLVGGVQTLEPYEQGVVGSLTAHPVSDACHAPGGGATWLPWALLLLALAGLGGGAWWWRARHPDARLADLARLVLGRTEAP